MAYINRAGFGLIAFAFATIFIQAQQAFGHQIHVDVKCSGNEEKAKITIKWGHPDFGDNTQEIVVHRGDRERNAVLEIPDNSEFEIQTEGGHDTTYEIRGSVDGKSFFIRYDHGEKEFADHGIHIVHTAGPNGTGEGNVRVHIER